MSAVSRGGTKSYVDDKKIFDIKKFPGDKKQYRGIVLENKMKVLIISDPETKKGATCLNLNIGKTTQKKYLIFVSMLYLCRRNWVFGTSSLSQRVRKVARK